MSHPLYDLTLLIRSRQPIIPIETVKKTRPVDLVTDSAQKLGTAMYTWTIIDSLSACCPQSSRRRRTAERRWTGGGSVCLIRGAARGRGPVTTNSGGATAQMPPGRGAIRISC